MVYNAADEKKIKALEERVKMERDQEIEDVKDILSRASGMRFFRRMFEKGKIFTTTFTGNSHGFFLEGHRNFALEYLSDVCEAAPEKMVELMIKRKEEKQEKEEENND